MGAVRVRVWEGGREGRVEEGRERAGGRRKEKFGGASRSEENTSRKVECTTKGGLWMGLLGLRLEALFVKYRRALTLDLLDARRDSSLSFDVHCVVPLCPPMVPSVVLDLLTRPMMLWLGAQGCVRAGKSALLKEVLGFETITVEGW